MDSQPQARMHAVVEGRVQGVGFRYFVLDKTANLPVKGWVRNTHDDKVEVVAEGDRKSLELLLVHLRRGPRSALVMDVKTEWLEARGEFKRFELRPTG